MISKIEHKGKLYAMVISSGPSEPGVNFVTPNEASLQVGFMNHPAGKKISPHLHIPTTRNLYFTYEVLIIKQGKLRVDFYNEQKNYLESRILEAGDVILLESGGHGFEVLEDIEMIEVKQGPYMADTDKDRFEGIQTEEAILPKGPKHG